MIFFKEMHDLQSFPKEKNVPGQKPTMDKEIFDTDGFSLNLGWNGILFPKLFWPSMRKKYSIDQENLLKFEAEGQEFAKKVDITRTIYSNSER